METDVLPQPKPEAIRSRTQELRLYLDANPHAPDRPVVAMDIAKINFSQGKFDFAQGWAQKVVDKVKGDATLTETNKYYKEATADAHILLGAIEATTALTQNPPDFTQLYTHLAAANTIFPNHSDIRLFTRLPLAELERMKKEKQFVKGEEEYDNALIDVAIQYREKIQSDPSLFLASLRSDISPFPEDKREEAVQAISDYVKDKTFRLRLDPAQTAELAANLLLWKQKTEGRQLEPIPDDDLAYQLKMDYKWATLDDPRFYHMEPDAFDSFASEQTKSIYHFLQEDIDPHFTAQFILSGSENDKKAKLQQLVTLYKTIEELPLKKPTKNNSRSRGDRPIDKVQRDPEELPARQRFARKPERQPSQAEASFDKDLENLLDRNIINMRLDYGENEVSLIDRNGGTPTAVDRYSVDNPSYEKTLAQAIFEELAETRASFDKEGREYMIFESKPNQLPVFQFAWLHNDGDHAQALTMTFDSLGAYNEFANFWKEDDHRALEIIYKRLRNIQKRKDESFTQGEPALPAQQTDSWTGAFKQLLTNPSTFGQAPTSGVPLQQNDIPAEPAERVLQDRSLAQAVKN